MKRDTCKQNSRTFLANRFLALLLGVSASYCQRALVGESGMIIIQLGKLNRSLMVAVCGTPYSVPSRNSNSNLVILLKCHFRFLRQRL
jgi:hypothetical protein